MLIELSALEIHTLQMGTIVLETVMKEHGFDDNAKDIKALFDKLADAQAKIREEYK